MKRFSGLLFVFLFGFLAVIDLLHPGLPVTHDGQDHVARIANFYLNLSQGVIIPRWAENLNYGYGHPILEFLYPLPSYVASFFHFIGFSFVDATKLVYGIAMLASGITMYLFAKTLWGEKAGVVSGILYMYAPYHLVDLYVRGDIGEHVALVFVPLVFLSLFLLAKKENFRHLFSVCLSIAFLILSHNAIALMMMPLILLYMVFLLCQSTHKKKSAAILFGSFGLGFLLSSFFWFPALLEGQYTLRNIVTKGGYMSRFVSFPPLLYGQWNYGLSGMFTVQLGILPWIFLISSIVFIILFWKKQRSTSIFLLGLFVATLGAIFLMLPVSNFLWSRFMLLQNFQFPWRFLAIPVFTTALFGGFFIYMLPRCWQMGTTVVVCLLMLFLSKDYLHAKAYVQKPERFFTGIYARTTDTGESSPIWSVRFMEHGYSKPLQVISGKAIITPKKRLTTLHTYAVTSIGTSQLLENTLYFPGWKITVDGAPVAIQFQDPHHRGLMTFFVASGMHEVAVSYHDSKLRIMGDMLSLVGLLAVVWLFVLQKKKYL